MLRKLANTKLASYLDALVAINSKRKQIRS